MNSTLEKTRGGIVVSCQTRPPLSEPYIIAAICQAVVESGAAGLRVNSPENVEAVRANLSVPIIGINKIRCADSQVYITPTIESAVAVVDAGAEIVALDGIGLTRPDGSSLSEIIAAVHERNALVMADIATFDEGINAAQAGADIVASTLSGYTPQSEHRLQKEPDFELLEQLCTELDCPIIAEGRIATPEHVERAFEMGVHAVVVGKAITEPRLLAQKFIEASPRFQSVN